ncbi:MAG: hypothetical protein V1723_01725 [Candidatus Uhrbacteria bacterium]
MTRQMLIIEESMNETPEEKVAERIRTIAEEARSSWRIVSAMTSLAPVGEMDVNEPGAKFEKVARHVYYVTTVIIELF